MDAEFLLGGAIAFLLALIAWTDQIHGIRERVTNHERDFLSTYKTKWKSLQKLIRPSEGADPAARLLAALGLLHSGAMSDTEDIRVYEEFERVDRWRNLLQRAYQVRFWLIFSTAVEMFCGGVWLIHAPILDTCWELSVESALHFGTVVLIASILLSTLLAAVFEKCFREHLFELEDQLRLARERRPAVGG